MFKKFLFSLILFLIPYSLFVIPVHAEGEFFTDATVEYKVDASEKTTVTHQITLENAFSTMYASAYSIVLDNIHPQSPRAYEDKGTLPLDVKTDGDKTILKVTFNDALVGKGKTRTFYISYQEGSFAVRTGEVWEISIPRLQDSGTFRNYTVILKVPDSFGQEAYISPKPQNSGDSEGFRTYNFSKDAVSGSGITAGFGQFQVFSFTLNYHLENPLSRTSLTEIAIPPDTAYQKVYYQSISVPPDNVRMDEDGNWLATFRLNPRERLDVSAKGVVQIFASARPFLVPTAANLQSNLKDSNFWQVSDPQIRTLGQKLGTPKAIYNYVSTNLSYDYQRVRPNVERLGASAALSSPKSAICMEYTDLFVALTRASGIPAREVNGYAYTENKDIQPLSLVADVLHAWPEYWDTQRSTWIPVDPTWGSTTHGVDFFSKLDLRHFTFVIHGVDSQKPYPPGSYKLGSNPQKDVFVSFGQLPSQKTAVPEIVSRPASTLPFTNEKIQVIIANPGPVALYDLTPVVFFDGKAQNGEVVKVLPPFSKYELPISVPFSFLGEKTPGKITVLVSDKRVEIPTFKNQVILYNLIALFIIFAIFITFIFFRVRKDILERLLGKFRKNNETNTNSSQGPAKPQGSQ